MVRKNVTYSRFVITYTTIEIKCLIMNLFFFLLTTFLRCSCLYKVGVSDLQMSSFCDLHLWKKWRIHVYSFFKHIFLSRRILKPLAKFKTTKAVLSSLQCLDTSYFKPQQTIAIYVRMLAVSYEGFRSSTGFSLESWFDKLIVK